MLEGAIFDADGTLLDSMSMWDNLAAEYICSLGFEPEADINDKLAEMSVFQAACYYKEVYRLNMSVDELIQDINRFTESYYAEEVLLKCGAEDFLKYLSGLGVKMCAASATDGHLLSLAFARCGIAGYFSGIFTCASVGSDKSKPLIYRTALSFLGTDKKKTLVFEDAFYALQTAKTDGFLTAGVFDEYEKNQSGVKNISDIYLSDFNNLADFKKFASLL